MLRKLIRTTQEKLLKNKEKQNPAPPAPQAESKAAPRKPAEPVTQSARPPVKPAGTQRRRKRKKPSSKTGSAAPSITKGKAETAGGPPWNPSAFEVPPLEGRTRFHDLNLPDEIMHGIFDLEFEYCTPIQAGILPKTLAGNDASGKAQTGTGKTAAFLITILTYLQRNPQQDERKRGTPRALIMVPTRELALQVKKEALQLGKHCRCEVVAIFGGMDYQKQQQMLTDRVIDIIVATPGRLLDFKRRGDVHLDKVEILVIDEADEMLNMGFIPDIRTIVNSTPPKSKRQTMFFGATLTPEVARLSSQWTRDPVTVEIDPEQVAVDSVDQVVYLVRTRERFTVLYNLITQKDLKRVIVFCNRRDQTRILADRVRSHGISCAMLSGEVAQRKRIQTVEDFRSGRIRVMVSTDVAGRGIHIDDISHVVNYNLPLDAEDYVHRIGRTGRAGSAGISISFATEDESYLLPAIEDYMGRKLHCVYPDDALLTPIPPSASTAAPPAATAETAQAASPQQRTGSYKPRRRRSGGSTDGSGRSRTPHARPDDNPTP